MTLEPVAQRRMRRCRGLSWTETPDGLAVNDTDFAKIHFLNHTAAAVFMLCGETLPLDAIAQTLGEEMKLAAPPFADVEDCIELLLQLGLVEEVPNGG